MFEIGNSLREARVRQGLDYSQVELATKIRAKYLRALEEEQFEILPTGTYIKGFMRSYADFLGLDGELYVDEYNSRYVAEGFDDMPQRRPRDPAGARASTGGSSCSRSSGSRSLTALVIVAWKFGGGDSPDRDACRRHAAEAGGAEGARASSASARARISRSAAARRSGQVVFQGTLRPGDKQFIVGPRFWLSVRRPSGVRFTLARQARRAAGAPQPASRRHADEDRPRHAVERLSRPRAVVVVTGSELVRGERTDLNGPFLASEALRLGLEPARIAIVGDAPEELEAALRDALATADAVLVSGGLGPTHDDRTVEFVAKALGVGLHVDPELEAQIESVSRAAAERLRRDYADFAPGVTKQATVPDGAVSLGLAGTAPGLLVPRDGRTPRRRAAGAAGRAAAAVAERARDRRRSGRSSRAPRRPAAACSASSASASRRSRGRSQTRAATATGWR